MNLNNSLQHSRSGWSRIAVIAAVTLATLAISIYCLSSNWLIVFQNLFYFPIIIACIYYAKKGFAFSVVLSLAYFLLIILFTRDSAVLLQASIMAVIFVGIAGVITFLAMQHRRTADKLQKAKEFAENLLNTANVMVVGLDLQGRVTIFNTVAEKITGYTRAEMLNRIWFETVVPKARYPEVWEKFEKLSREGDIGTFENPILTRSGEERYIAWQNSQILEGGHVTGTLSFGMDVSEHMRVEDALRESTERYRSLYVDSRDAIMILSPERGFLAGNPAAIKLFGCRDEQDFTTRTPASLSPEYQPGGMASSDKSQEMMRLAMEKGSHLFEWTHRRADGTDFPATVLLSRLESSAAQLLQATVHDITEPKRVDAALAWERGLFTLLMDNLPDRIYFKDRMSRFIRASRSQALGLGLADPLQLIGKSDADFFSADHAHKAVEDEQQLIRTGEPVVDIEERLTYPDRPDSWVLTTKMPLRDPAGTIAGTFGISHDITARKQLEAKNQQLATLVESADDAIGAMDMDGRITVWNRGAERMYGYSAEQMNGTATSSLMPPDLEKEARLMREQVMRGEQITNYETTQLRKDGSKISVSLTLSAIRDSEGRIVGMASVARDVTAQKALEAQLNRVQRLESLATLAGGVAHQFNNINTVVRGYLELMQSEKRLPARLAKYVKAANAGVQKAVDITDRLLALTEPGGRTIALHLDVLARTLLPLHAKRIEEEKVQLVLDLAETPLVQGSEVRLKFVLSSLIGNALDSLLDRPVRMVNIRTGCAKDAAWFEVADSGCGIPEEDLPRIFSPFFSAKGEWAPPGSPQARLKGVGLSLAMSSTTVSEYGGRIDVQSTKGVGSTFRVTMPLAAAVP